MQEKIILQYEIEQWLYKEAELLDELNFDAWYELLDEEIKYIMPLRINQMEESKPDYSEATLLFDDDSTTLRLRIDRLKTDMAWAELPPSRTRRNVSNVKIKEVSGNEVTVRSNLLLYRSRSTDTTADLISGEREDVLRNENGKWKLVSRWFLADQTSLATRNLAIFV
ncbi:aromatic-ring-hydroxylating dioxygenase subunit beta [Sporosarcina pasteurii]|uniref:Biphenyl dioxygenase subunit beta n=1 Tax=Sporosarcina pasteurii TaxID=1474 RepID=A0A380C4C5_SPOPA|nr:aromatic-ring-hydroxylating dioxygenase subunit beta [Sporosarcina pasteurii]MDS9471632.1 aromatic-ring-hydroxylating dioxygenase subunit beta [Sporosarcina pasteurii]QBQ04760.1 3-phenylpropionate/cinnamic acid dioxygenase subunit beta [Sporosarcina pasteurii]SUJ11502.1 Biphenyl dioxygenase subunit beta [Sporosarcina pasteurii]